MENEIFLFSHYLFSLHRILFSSLHPLLFSSHLEFVHSLFGCRKDPSNLCYKMATHVFKGHFAHTLPSARSRSATPGLLKALSQ